MIRIGEFAKLFDVSIKTIRLYEEKKLLFPCFVDKYSGYRYYDEQNIAEMSKIIVLKELGLSLREIQNFGQEMIASKIEEYECQMQKMKKNLQTLKSLSHNEGEIKTMKPFVNDECIIGKWQLLGIAETKESAKQELWVEDDFKIYELYALPEGEKYWVISWTKGSIYLKENECPYEIIDDKMYVNIVDPLDKNFYKVAVYEKVDDKAYTTEEIKKKDNTKLPFVEDKQLKGCWQTVDFVNKIENFIPNKKTWPGELFLEKIIVPPDNECIATFKDNTSKSIRYTKNTIINLCIENTTSSYVYIKENCIAVEWKSNDYVYGRMINGYYILTRIENEKNA